MNSPDRPEPGRARWVLAGACAGLTVLMLDSTVVNLALPELRADLDASTSELQWIPNAYLLVIAALVVTAGRLGDIVGRKRMFVAGMLCFGAGSLIGGFAGDPVAVIAARLVQGVGAAAVLPLSLTLVNDAYAPEERARAMGIWAAVSALALAVGPIAGGTLSQIDWRLIFFINVPIVVFGIFAIARYATEIRDESAPPKIDIPGVATLSIGLATVTLALVEAEGWGWTSAKTIGLIAIGLLSLAAFWAIEHRVRDPIVDFALFRNGPYFGASAAAFALVGAYWAVMFFQPQYLQDILDYSPTAAGLLILPVTLPMVVLSPFAGRLIAAFGARATMTVGMLFGVAGLLVQAQASAADGYGPLLVGYLLFGIALGLVYAPMSVAAMAAMPESKAGIASGVLAMNRVLAGALALAACGAVFHSTLTGQIESEAASRPLSERDAGELEGLASGAPSAQAALARQPAGEQGEIRAGVDDAYDDALSAALWIVVVLVAVGSVLTWAFVRAPSEAGAAPDQGRPEHQHHRRFHL